MQLLLASAALVYGARLLANPTPRTMTKEWQEASNEYAKVCRLFIKKKNRKGYRLIFSLLSNRVRASIPFTVLAVRATRVRDLFRANLSGISAK